MVCFPHANKPACILCYPAKRQATILHLIWHMHCVQWPQQPLLCTAAFLCAGAEVVDLQELSEAMERHRMDAMERLVKKYRTVPPLLGKIEEVVAGTNTGKSPVLAGYYAYWERALFNALNEMVLRAMGTLQAMVDQRARRLEAAARKPPLFKVTFSLQGSDVVVQPPMNEVNKTLGRLVRSMVESTKSFVRWMDGTCIEAPEQKGASDDDEPVAFTFYWDVAGNPQVIRTMLQLNQSIQRTIAGVNRYADSWRRHQTLWKTDKGSVLDKFKARDPPAAAFEEKLSKYTKVRLGWAGWRVCSMTNQMMMRTVCC